LGVLAAARQERMRPERCANAAVHTLGRAPISNDTPLGTTWQYQLALPPLPARNWPLPRAVPGGPGDDDARAAG